MPTVAESGIAKSMSMPLLFQRADGKWTLQTATVEFVEGHLHKIQWPGFETRSGDQFGITATVHLLQGLKNEGAAKGTILRMDYVGGVVAKAEPLPGEHEIVVQSFS